jgi:C-terminal processing protease CtpA/Prc
MRNVITLLLVLVILVCVFFIVLHSRHHVRHQSFVALPSQHHVQPQSITGIGVELTMRNHALKIMGVLTNTPAAKAGLHPGLIIQQIDGANIVGQPLAECVAMMRGPVGSTVQLEVIDPVKSHTNIVEFTREKISLPVAMMRPAPVTH